MVQLRLTASLQYIICLYLSVIWVASEGAVFLAVPMINHAYWLLPGDFLDDQPRAGIIFLGTVIVLASAILMGILHPYVTKIAWWSICIAASLIHGLSFLAMIRSFA